MLDPGGRGGRSSRRSGRLRRLSEVALSTPSPPTAARPVRLHVGATFRAALKLSLDQWAQRQAGTLGNEPRFTRGHRVDLLKDVTAPLAGMVPADRRVRLEQALSLVFGVETLVVLKDIWGLSAAEARDVADWAAAALVDATMNQSA